MQRKRNTDSEPDHRGKEKYKGKKDTIHKKREERKPKQKKDE
jgi:hypothetical protein